MTLVTVMMLPATLAQHPRVDRSRAQERAAHVHRHRAVPLLDRDLVPRAPLGVGGVGHEDVDIPELGFRLRHHAVDVRGHADVRRDLDGTAAALDDALDDAARQGVHPLLRERVDHDARPLAGERLGDGCADAPRGTGHDGDSVGQAAHQRPARSAGQRRARRPSPDAPAAVDDEVAAVDEARARAARKTVAVT